MSANNAYLQVDSFSTNGSVACFAHYRSSQFTIVQCLRVANLSTKRVGRFETLLILSKAASCCCTFRACCNSINSARRSICDTCVNVRTGQLHRSTFRAGRCVLFCSALRTLAFRKLLFTCVTIISLSILTKRAHSFPAVPMN